MRKIIIPEDNKTDCYDFNTKKNKRINNTPINFFTDTHQKIDKQRALFAAIREGIHEFIKDSQGRRDWSIFNKKLHYTIINHIKILLECGLGIDLLFYAHIAFHKDMGYMPWIVKALIGKVDKNVKLLPALTVANAKDFFWQMGSKYYSLGRINKHDDGFIKLAKILNRYNIIFLQSKDGKCNSIVTPPMSRFIEDQIRPKDIAFIIEMILKNTAKDSFLIETSSQYGTITISKTEINFLADFQNKILKHSKKMMQIYFKSKKIRIERCITEIVTPGNSRKPKSEPAVEKNLICMMGFKFENIKVLFQKDLGHYCLQLYPSTIKSNRLVISGNNSLIEFLEGLYKNADENIFTITDIIINILANFSKNTMIKKIKTGTHPKNSGKFFLNIPILSEKAIDHCQSQIDIAARSFSLNLAAIANQSYIGLVSSDKALLLMLEVKLKGLTHAFMKLITAFGAVDAPPASPKNDFTLIKSVPTDKVSSSLFAIQAILGSEFKVNLMHDMEKNKPMHTSFFQLGNSQGHKSAKIFSEKLAQIETELLIQGKDNHDTDLLKYFCDSIVYLQVNDANLPKPVKDTIFKYYSDVPIENPTSSCSLGM